MTQGFSIEFLFNLNSISIFNIKDYNMGNLLLVNCIKVYIDKETVNIQLSASLFTHKMGQCNIFCVNCSQTIEKRTNLLYD